MKKINLITFAIISIFALTLTSCDKDDDSTKSSSNSFTLNGTTYDLEEGILEDYGSNGNGSYDFDISLIGGGLSFDTNSESVTGTGEAIYLDLNSDSMDDLSDGTYIFATDRDAFTLVVGGILVDYDFDAQSGTTIEANAGSVVLSKSGNTYDIEFDLTSANGDVITGSFRGTLPRF